MGVTLRERKNKKDGSTTLLLDIYHDGKRKYEFLTQLKLVKPANPSDREANRKNKELAKKIAVQRAAELQASDYNMTAEHKGKADFIIYWENYIARYTKKDKRNMEGACNAFKKFMAAEGIKSLTMKGLTETQVEGYADYLEANHKGEGACSYFARFKKMMKHAMREKVLQVNPAAEISVKRDMSIKKNVLTLDEIKALAGTNTANEELKRAFLFSCFTGLRWVDVKALQWQHIDRKSKILSITQAKTGLNVTAPLHQTALSFLPEPGKPGEFVFDLPSHTGALKTLKAWVKRAGIEKEITWHCARHSFATNLITLKADVTTVSKLLGHTSLKYTQRYTHISDELKRAAIDSLPTINL